MISILCLEDNDENAREIETLIAESAFPAEVSFERVQDVVTAKRKLSERIYDVAILDIQVPMRAGEAPKVDGGVVLLDFIETSPHSKRPRYVVGITAERESLQISKDRFLQSLFSLLERRSGDDAWRRAIRAFIGYVVGQQSEAGSANGVGLGVDGPVALAIVCALPTTELNAVKRWLSCEWSDLDVPDDPSHYLIGSVEARSGRHKVVAVAAPEQGMAASAALVSKLAVMFRPRFVAMCGIAAAVAKNVNFGDVLVATQTWDYTTGKLFGDGESTERHLAENRSIKADAVVLDQMQRLSLDSTFRSQLKDKWPATTPDSELKLHLGPVASGGAVVESKDTIERIRERDRKTIGLDMEAHGVATACWYARRPNPCFVVAKAVVDFGVPPKEDVWQDYAAYTSASVVAEWARRFL